MKVRGFIFAALFSALAHGQDLYNWPERPSHAFVFNGTTTTGATLSLWSGLALQAGPIGGTTFAESAGRLAYTFNGTNQMLFAGVTNFAAETTNGTIVARVRLTAPTTTTFRVFTSGTATGPNQFALIQIANGLAIWDIKRTTTDESYYSQTGAGFTTSRWHTVGFTTDGFNGQLFVDGSPVPQTTNNAGGGSAGRWFSHATGTQHVALGNFKRNTDVYSPGRVSAIIVFPRKFTDVEMMTVHSILNVAGANQP